MSTARDDGLAIVRLPPKGGRDSIDGIVQLSDGSAVLKARVAAAPTEGEANGALARLLARKLRVAPRDVMLVGGATSRIRASKPKATLPAIVSEKRNGSCDTKPMAPRRSSSGSSSTSMPSTAPAVPSPKCARTSLLHR